VSQTTYHRRRHLYGGTQVQEAKRLSQLETANEWLKRLLALAVLEKAMLKEQDEGNCLARNCSAGLMA